MFLHIADGSGEKIQQCLVSIGTVISGMCIALFRGPYLALICMIYFPVFVVIMNIFGKSIQSQTI